MSISLDLSLSGRHRAFGGISIDAFLAAMGLTGSNAGADFNAGRYWLPSLYDSTKPVECREDDWFANFTRASEATGTNADGSLKTYAANKPTFNWSGGKRWLGNNDTRTNKCTCRKHNPIDLSNLTKGGDASATLSIVDDTTALTAGGLSNICTNGNVYKLDNSTGTTPADVYINGDTNTNMHQFSAYVRGGSGFVCAQSFAEGSQSFGASPTYRRVSCKITPTTTRKGRIQAAAGQVVYFILPQLEESTFVTPVIAGDTLSAVTRAVDNCRLPTAMEAVLQGAAASVVLSFKADNKTGQCRYLGGATNHGILTGNSTNLMATNGSIYPAVSANLNNAVKVGVSWISGSMSIAANGGIASNAAGGSLPNFLQSYLGRDGNNDPFGDGLYSRIVAFPSKLSDAKLQAITA